MLDGLSTLAIVPKAKAIAARRLTKSEYEALARKRSVIEVTAALQAHPSFKKCLAGVSQTNLHRAQLEEALRKDIFFKYESLMRYSFRKGHFGAYFLMRCEIDELLTKLRLLSMGFHHHYIVHLPGFLADKTSFSLLALALALLPVFCWILVEVWKLLCRIRLRPVRYLPESALAVFLFCTALVLVLGAIHIPREFLPMENVFDMDFYAGSVREFLGQVQSLGEVVPQYRELEHLYQTGLKLFGIFVAGVWGGTLWLAVKRKR